MSGFVRSAFASPLWYARTTSIFEPASLGHASLLTGGFKHNLDGSEVHLERLLVLGDVLE